MGIKVSATSYNALQTQVAGILGTGSGDSGYGQSVASGQVTQSVSIKSLPWVNLRNDLLKARQHQTGLDETAKISSTAVGEKIKDAIYQGAITMGNNIVTNRLVQPPDSQVSVANLATSSAANGWNGTINHTVVIDFASADAMRFFFNSGSSIDISAGISGYPGSGSDKGPTWYAMFTGMGTIRMNHNSTTCTGSGTNSAIGYRQLTGSYQQIFRKDAPAGNYSSNIYLVYAQANSATQLQFLIQLQDNAGGGQDEPVDGALYSYVKARYSSGSNVQVAVPTVSSNTVDGGWTALTSLPLQDINPDLIAAGIQQYIEVQFTAIGGIAPITWSGGAPPNFTFRSDGLLYGSSPGVGQTTPSVSGSYNVTATDSRGYQITQTISYNFGPSPGY